MFDDDIDDNEGEADWEKVADFCWSCLYKVGWCFKSGNSL